MKTDEIKLLYDYNYWANRRILTTCAKVSDDQYVAPAGYGKSLRETLVHTLDAEQDWRKGLQRHFVPLDALKSRTPAAEPKKWEGEELTEADLPTLAVLEALWHEEEREMRAYLDSLSDQDLDGLVRYRVPEGFLRERVLWHCLVHIVNHGTQHRSEVASMLTSYGQSPGGLDFTAFLNERSNRQS